MPTAKESEKKEGKRAPAHPASAGHAMAHRSAAHAASHAASRAAHAMPKGRYFEGVGRRKTAIARVRLFPDGKGTITVNGMDADKYFPVVRLAAIVGAPLRELQMTEFDVVAKVSGGGVSAQAEAVRHGLARAILVKDPAWKPRLRAMGYVTRDSRMVERKKYGLRKARRAPQWAKR